LAALSDSPSVIRGPLMARDTLLAVAALRVLGYEITQSPSGTDLTVCGQSAITGPVSVDVGNAGTVMRFLPAIAAQIDDGGRGALPFTVHGRGAVPGGTVTLDASGSSQLVSGLLLAAPRFAAGVEVRHDGPPVPSLPHIEMTVQMLRDAGATVDVGAGERPDHWVVRPGQLNLGDFTVEPDLSNAG